MQSRLRIILTRYRPLWDVTIAGLPQCPVWCRLVTVPLITFTRPTGPFLPEWSNCRPVNTQNSGTILPIVKLMADSESGSPSSYLHFRVTIALSCLLSKIFVCEREKQRDRRTMRTITIAGSHIVAGQLTRVKSTVANEASNSSSSFPILYSGENFHDYASLQ